MRDNIIYNGIGISVSTSSSPKLHPHIETYALVQIITKQKEGHTIGKEGKRVRFKKESSHGSLALILAKRSKVSFLGHFTNNDVIITLSC